MNKVDEIKDLKSLGKKVENYEYECNKNLLEAFENSMKSEQMVRLDVTEFTTLCPITGQPDFATIEINYVPDKYLVESKSLKLYMFSFRNSGNFHETTIDTILNDLVELLNPKYIEVIGRFYVRGGISINPFANYASKNGGYEEMVKERKFQLLNAKI